MILPRIEALLKEKMGLDAASIGTASVERAVRQRLAAFELSDEQLYWERVSSSETELQELIEAVVVGETWFFRDREAFTVLVRLAQEWLAQHAEGMFRVLSVPCSTGEEPYSIAMALHDMGLPPQRFQIDAVDISTRAIAYAERGIYGRNSFRGQDLLFRDRHFTTAEGQRHSVNEAVRRQVRFRHGNLLSSGWLPGAHGYEAIFCRNVLIYFDRPTQDRALEVLGRLLMPAGALLVGPSETALLMDHGFEWVPVQRAFAFRRPKSAPPKSQSQAQGPQPRRPAIQHAPAAPVSSKQKKSAKSAATPAPRQDEGKPQDRQWIGEAQRLANEGKLMEAMQSCERHLRDQPASAEAFYLIGLLHDAARHPREAAEYYRKALYMDPKHHEALVHLAVVLEKEGDAKGARRLFERANRGADKK